MALWKWQGLDAKGKRHEGEMDVSSEKELRKSLKVRGIRLKRYHKPSILDINIGEIFVKIGLIKPFGPKELQNFTEQLSTMINAGIPILQSLEILQGQEKNPSLKSSIRKISVQVGEGKTLAQSMRSEKGFGRLYCNLIKAGEAGGILDQILEKLATFLGKQNELKRKVKSALTYPSIVVLVGMAVIYLLLTFVVPKFTSMLTESGQEIPWVTQVVIDISDWLNENVYIFIPAMIGLGVFFVQFIQSEVGKPIWDRLIMRAPLFGSLVIEGNLGSFAQTLSTLVASGISLVDALEICTETIDNIVIAKDVRWVRKQLVEGSTFADPLMQITYFPTMVSQMVKIGEQTGNLDQMLTKVGGVFEKNVEVTVGNLTTLIEPIILVVLGGIVGFLLVAMYLPIFMTAGTF